MKKFEEEIFGKVETMITQPGCSMTRKGWYSAGVIHDFSEDWVSPEEHQAEIGKIELQNLKYREEIARMQKSLRKKNKAIKELNGAVKKSEVRLKECEDLRIEANNKAAMEYSRKCEVVEDRAELKRENQRLRAENIAVKTLVEDAKKQRPEIPEVPQFVAEWYEENKGSLDYMIFETCRTLMDESTDEFENWFGYDNNKAITTLVNMKNGYTVKEKRFYLKHIDFCKRDKDYDWYMIKHSDGPLNHLRVEKGTLPPTVDTYFTQQEIDSMETGSYEQIEVQE